MIRTNLGEIPQPEDLTVSMVLDSLRGVDCQACGKPKRQWAAFCKVCYRKLPDSRRDDLLVEMKDGFDEAFRAALKFLAS